MATEQSFVEVKVDLAAQCKTQGNVAFKSKDFRRAEAFYKRGLQFLESPQSCQYSREELGAVGPILGTLHVNIAACCLQDGAANLDKCISHCTQAIKHDPLNVKAWYRRSQAYLKQRDFALAKHDITEALRLDQPVSSNHTTFRKHLASVQAASSQAKLAEKATFQGMFQ